ncbi:MAG: hypothetical protein RLZ45_101, partial [Verrucomicrobiota bacterium]
GAASVALGDAVVVPVAPVAPVVPVGAKAAKVVAGDGVASPVQRPKPSSAPSMVAPPPTT